MRYITTVATGTLLCAALFSSCTCHKQVSEPEASKFEAPSGFHASGIKITPMRRVEAPAVTPVVPKTPEVVAQAQRTPPSEVPPDFPPDMPIYKDASISEIQDLANQAHNVVFKSADSVPDIYNFYYRQLSSKGWQVTQQVQREKHAFISFRKGDMIAHLTIAEDIRNPGKQVIAIMYEQEKPLPFEEF